MSRIIRFLEPFALLAVVALAIYLTSPGRSRSKQLHTQPASHAFDKKKIVVLTSSGGGGHESVTKALTSFLGDRYDIRPVYMFDEVLGSMDPIKKITFGRSSGEGFYNYCLKKQWYGFLNHYQRFGQWYNRHLERRIVRRLRAFINREQPDLMLSVIPMINGHALKAAREANIPFLLVPTDIDIKTAIAGVGEHADYTKFRITVPMKDKNTLSLCTNEGIPESRLTVAGFPLRPEFGTAKDVSTIKSSFELSHEKPNILVMMGAQGSTASLEYAKQLSELSQPAHLIIVLGRNETLRQQVQRISFPDHISTTILGFTPHIADLMAASDLCITKSGPNSIYEAIYSNLPLMVDAVGTMLFWERLNPAFVRDRGFGTVITKRRKTASLLDDLLTNGDKLATMRSNLAQFEKRHFGQEVRSLVGTLIEGAPAQGTHHDESTSSYSTHL